MMVNIKMKNNYYEILGVAKDASSTDIKKAYHKQQMQYHPDKNKSSGAEEKSKDINEAYQVLSDLTKRQQYDQSINIENPERKAREKAEDVRNEPFVNHRDAKEHENDPAYSFQKESFLYEMKERARKARDVQKEQEMQETLRKKKTDSRKKENSNEIWQNSKYISIINTTILEKTKTVVEKSWFLGFGKRKKLVDVFVEKEVENRVEIRKNSIGMKFTRIPAGEFMMGSLSDDNEGPVHKVTIGKPFYIGTYPVTQREWKAVMGDTPSFFKGDDLPVENISWNDVQEFIQKLNKKEAIDKYRLPSEAEWEYACRAGTTTKYCFGNDESKLGEYAWYDGNSGNKTHPINLKKPNPWGLYDMHGNVWEWVQDIWHDSYNGAPTDGSVWKSGGDSNRVHRCGSWRFNAYYCQSAHRGSLCTTQHYDFLGFRLLRVL